MGDPQFSPGFFGPAMPRVDRQGERMRRAAAATPAIRLPSSVRRDLKKLGEAAERAAEGDARAVTDTQRTLLHRATMGPTTADYARIESIGYDAWLEEQLAYELIDDGELENVLRQALGTLEMSAQQIYSQYQSNPFIPIFELWVATFYRALYSPRQLFERMAIFWSDHFSIDVFGDYQNFLKPVDDRLVVRRYAMGNFADLLSASAHSASMLVYLTNDTNERNHPNENYARELMELHTMGADNGYTEKDVKEVARCFTGWTWENPYRGLGEIGTFRFSSFVHDTASKRLLGRRIPAGGGIEDGERVLEILVRRKETAEFIATKMLRYLWGYEPGKPAVRKVAKAFQNTNGNIRSLMRTALRKQRLRSATPKLKRPFHMIVSALRALGADVQDARRPLDALSDAGHLPFAWTPPNGYPDSAQFWSGFLMPRWNYAARLLEPGQEGIVIDPALDDPSGSPGSIVDRLDKVLLGGTMSADTRDAVRSFLNKGPSNRKRVGEAIGLVLSSPDFQEY